LGGNRTNRSRSRVGVIALVILAVGLIALALSTCGGDDSSSDSGEAAGTYRAEVVKAQFPARQRLGETTLMRLAVRNTGESTIPNLVVSVTVGGEAGETSSLPFAIRDPQPGLAEPERPVWILSENYPKLAGSDDPGGAQSANNKIFGFGPLEADETVSAVWQLTAVRTGEFRINYRVDAGFDGEVEAETADGVQPGGSFTAKITEETPDLTVTDSGEVVEIDEQRGRGK
jgi:hypothetical protein